ncbi:hypothetical protein JMJ56_28325 [Belnapia sp. T18]|uniref:Uncharacterized protein n=1 Tax=Belnapia arida TaxID=2804533 RepID=A0ABS1UCL1_9PROT|nr:hypothetical protein [Belnapia arida]MBL6081895.1 hypothetical protein [Belnapia arida]
MTNGGGRGGASSPAVLIGSGSGRSTGVVRTTRMSASAHASITARSGGLLA